MRSTLYPCLRLVGAICFLFSACVAYAETDNVVRIGVELPLTGSLAHVGVDIRRGMEMALEEEKTGPVRFEVIYEDNRHETRDAVTVAQKLLDRDHVDLLVTLWDMTDVVAPLADRHHVPLLAIRWNPHIAEQYKYVVTLESTYLTFVNSQAELLKSMQTKTLALITEESQGWLLASQALRDRALDFGFTVVADETISAKDTDLRSVISKLLAAKPDVFVTNAHQPTLDIILKRSRELRPEQKITGYFEAVEPPQLVEGLPFVAQFEVAPWFAERFRARYGEDFKVRAPHGYDVIKLFAHVYRKADRKVTADEMIDELSKIKDFAGATGTLTTNATKNIESRCVWRIVQNGKFVPLTPELLSRHQITN